MLICLRKIAELEKQVHFLTSAFNGSSNQSPQQTPASLSVPAQTSSTFISPPPPSAVFQDHAAQNGSFGSQLPRTPHYPAANPVQGGGPAIMSIFNVENTVGNMSQPSQSWVQPEATLPRSIKSAYLTGQEIDELFRMLVCLSHTFHC